uniref:Uncharacterized protein n=1 Tax=Arundo donax TaxID=35708 RepID=A0A0A9DIP0_ARUDO
MASPQPEAGLTDYERRREENIRRNDAILASLRRKARRGLGLLPVHPLLPQAGQETAAAPHDPRQPRCPPPLPPHPRPSPQRFRRRGVHRHAAVRSEAPRHPVLLACLRPARFRRRRCLAPGAGARDSRGGRVRRREGAGAAARGREEGGAGEDTLGAGPTAGPPDRGGRREQARAYRVLGRGRRRGGRGRCRRVVRVFSPQGGCGGGCDAPGRAAQDL